MMATLPSLSVWFLHLSSSSMKELIQGTQPLTPPCPSTLMSPNSLAYVRQYVKDVAYMPETTHNKGYGCLPRYRALEELLLKTRLWTSLKCHKLENININ
jgi:hypothetical protein